MARFPINESVIDSIVLSTSILKPFLRFHASSHRSRLLNCSSKVGNSALVCGISNMTVLLKNLFTVHILIWHTQIRSQHYLWWQNSAFMDTARRSATSALLRRCCGEEQRWIYIPIRCPWMQFEQVSPPPQNPKWVTTQHTISFHRGDTMLFGYFFAIPSLCSSGLRTQGFWITTGTFCQFHILLSGVLSTRPPGGSFWHNGVVNRYILLQVLDPCSSF